jgi:hypothetical protein
MSPVLVWLPVTARVELNVPAPENVLAPASVCAPVVTTPRFDADASGILTVTVPPSETGEPEMFTSVPDVPAATVIVEFARSAFATDPSVICDEPTVFDGSVMPVSAVRLVISEFEPDAAAPRFARAPDAVVDPVPPFVTGSDPVTFVVRSMVPFVISAFTINDEDNNPAAELRTIPAVENGVMIGAAANVAVPVKLDVPVTPNVPPSVEAPVPTVKVFEPDTAVAPFKVTAPVPVVNVVAPDWVMLPEFV